jgi:hypothetical protein
MGKYSEVFVAFDVAKKKHAVAIAEGGRPGRSAFSAMSRTVRCRSSGRSRDWRTDTSGCMSALKLGRLDTGFIARFRLSATIAWWSLRP